MKTCGLIVEYNPFHNGHFYHFQQSKEKTKADVVVAVMSGTFLQRGEPAIIDKFHRTKAALDSGIDIVLELPFAFSCQYADLFAKGAIMTLAKLGVENVCFGSEQGDITPFLNSYMHFKQYEDDFQINRQKYLKEGLSFPMASTKAYEAINVKQSGLDLSLPNNILGFSYIKAINDLKVNIQPHTIKRMKSNYHDEEIEQDIASATSIRKQMMEANQLTEEAKHALPWSTAHQLETYKTSFGVWHDWELYFPILQHIVQISSKNELKKIQGVEEGLENRIKHSANKVTSFNEWMNALKTKRYTWTRLQRTFVHILTNTKKEEVEQVKTLTEAPYVRILGMSSKGRKYVQQQKKHIDIPLITNIQQSKHPILEMEERATDAYYSVIAPSLKKDLRHQEMSGPILID
ncbi:nucleotidyltransferase [Bacillaceae bacterium W0354]